MNRVHIFNCTDSPETGAKKETASCEGCGSFEVTEIAGKTLCVDCISLAGCGCAGDE